MYVSDEIVGGKLQFAVYRDPSTKLGFWWGQDKNVNKNDLKFRKREIWWRPLANEPRTKASFKNLKNLKV